MPIWNPPAQTGNSGATVAYATLAAMRAGGVPVAGIFEAVLQNRATAFDGGGGAFTWLTGLGAALADDDCTIIVPAGAPVGAAWVRRFSGPVNIQWAGGTGGGVFDNTTALKNAEKGAQATSIRTAGGIISNPNGQIYIPTITLAAAQRNFYVNGTATLVSDIVTTQATAPGNPIGMTIGAAGNISCGDINNINILHSGIFQCRNIDRVQIQGGGTMYLGAFITNCQIVSSAANKVYYGATSINNGQFVVIRNSNIGLTGGVGMQDFGNNNLLIENSTINGNGGLIKGSATGKLLIIRDSTLPIVGPPNAAGAILGFGQIIVENTPVTVSASGPNYVFVATTSVILKNSPVTAAQTAIANAPFVSPSLTTPATPGSGVVVQNTAPVTVLASLTVTLNGNLAQASVTANLGPTTPPATTVDGYIAPVGSVNGVQVTVTVKVPPGWYYSFTGVNAAFGTLTLTAGE